MIWKFTNNKQFSRFNQTLYEQIIAKSNTTQVSNEGSLIMNNHKTMFFSFKNFISQLDQYVIKEYADFFVWLIIQKSFFIKIWINFEIIDLKGIQKSG